MWLFYSRGVNVQHSDHSRSSETPVSDGIFEWKKNTIHWITLENDLENLWKKCQHTLQCEHPYHTQKCTSKIHVHDGLNCLLKLPIKVWNTHQRMLKMNKMGYLDLISDLVYSDQEITVTTITQRIIIRSSLYWIYGCSLVVSWSSLPMGYLDLISDLVYSGQEFTVTTLPYIIPTQIA